MSPVSESVPRASPPRRLPILPAGTDMLLLGLILAAFAALYGPSYLMLAERVWPTDEQGHGPIILGVALYLLFGKRHALAALPSRPDRPLGYALLIFGVTLYALGRSQFILFFEVFSQIFVLAALVLLFSGRQGLRLVWFPLFFLLFMVPLPLPAPLPLSISSGRSSASLAAAPPFPLARGMVVSFAPAIALRSRSRRARVP